MRGMGGGMDGWMDGRVKRRRRRRREEEVDSFVPSIPFPSLLLTALLTLPPAPPLLYY